MNKNQKTTPTEKLLNSIGGKVIAKKIVKYSADGDLAIYDKDNKRLGSSENIIFNNSTCGCDDLKRLEEDN